MTTDNNRVNHKDPNRCSSGCGTVVGIVFFGLFFGILAFLDSGNEKYNANMIPKKEPISIDTCAMIKDSIRVYKAR